MKRLLRERPRRSFVVGTTLVGSPMGSRDNTLYIERQLHGYNPEALQELSLSVFSRTSFNGLWPLHNYNDCNHLNNL